MFDIFCHKITFVFQDTQVDVNDLIDLGKGVMVPQTKKQLIARLTELLDKRKAQHAKSLQKNTHDEEDTELPKGDRERQESPDCSG